MLSLIRLCAKTRHSISSHLRECFPSETQKLPQSICLPAKHSLSFLTDEPTVSFEEKGHSDTAAQEWRRPTESEGKRRRKSEGTKFFRRNKRQQLLPHGPSGPSRSGTCTAFIVNRLFPKWSLATCSGSCRDGRPWTESHTTAAERSARAKHECGSAGNIIAEPGEPPSDFPLEVEP